MAVKNTRHLIRLLLGAEEDWPRAFECLVTRLGPVRGADGAQHSFGTERLTIAPFDLRRDVRQGLLTSPDRIDPTELS